MSFQLRTGRSAGAISFPFEDLPITREGGERRAFGIATIAFDGAGGYWPTAIILDSSTFRGTSKALTDGSPLWREIIRRLEQHHSDAIAERINTALGEHGLHMALFGEHLPPVAVRRSVPPYVSPAARNAQLMLDRAALCTECATIALAGAALLLCMTIAEQQHEQHGWSPVLAASLISGDGH